MSLSFMKRKRGRKGIFDRGFASAKGDVFYVPFFLRKKKGTKEKLPKGELGAGSAVESEAFDDAPQAPFPPCGIPFNTPVWHRMLWIQKGFVSNDV
jgi:hypothetical protein